MRAGEGFVVVETLVCGVYKYRGVKIVINIWVIDISEYRNFHKSCKVKMRELDLLQLSFLLLMALLFLKLIEPAVQ